MELQSFAIGIITMIVFALAIITVVGILKVTRMASDLLTLKRRLEDDERELSREINMIESTMRNQTENRFSGMYQALDEVSRQDKAYTDKRIDKLIDTYFEHVGAKKQILKD